MPTAVGEGYLGEEYKSSYRLGREVAVDIVGVLVPTLRPPLAGLGTLSEGLIQLRSTFGRVIPRGEWRQTTICETIYYTDAPIR